MKLSVAHETPIAVVTEVGDFEVGPAFIGSRNSPKGSTSGVWAVVAISPDPLTPHRLLSRKFPNAEAVWKAFRSGFEVLDPAREPRLTGSKIVNGMLRNPAVASV
jgi:hypothetical protein